MYRKLFLLFVLFFIILPGQALTFRYGGMDRTYFIHVPECYDSNNKTPLVIALHGGGGLAKRMEHFTRFDELSEKENFIVVYPQGYKRQWNDGREAASIPAQELNIDDVGFINALIDTLYSQYNIDSSRIYVTGLSNGGFMTTRIGCELGNRIAAIAPMISTLPKKLNTKCNPVKAMPVMLINGTDDPLVPYDGGFVRVGRKTRGEILSTDETIEFWIQVDQCTTKPDIIKIEDKDKTDDCTATAYIYPDGAEDSEVVLIKVNGGGHTIPGGRQYLPKSIIGNVCRDFIAEELILEFFKNHPKNTDMSQH